MTGMTSEHHRQLSNPGSSHGQMVQRRLTTCMRPSSQAQGATIKPDPRQQSKACSSLKHDSPANPTMVLANTTIVGYSSESYQKRMNFCNRCWLLMQFDERFDGPSLFRRHKLCVENSATFIVTEFVALEIILNGQKLMGMGPRWSIQLEPGWQNYFTRSKDTIKFVKGSMLDRTSAQKNVQDVRADLLFESSIRSSIANRSYLKSQYAPRREHSDNHNTIAFSSARYPHQATLPALDNTKRCRIGSRVSRTCQRIIAVPQHDYAKVLRSLCSGQFLN